MINLAPIRAAAAAAPGNMVALSKAQLAQLLDETEIGQEARRQLKLVSATEGMCGHRAGIEATVAR